MLEHSNYPDTKKYFWAGSSIEMELYESSLDALLALHEECSTSNTLSKDQNVVRFLNKCEYLLGPVVIITSSRHVDNTTVEELRKQRLSIDDFELKNIIGQGHFGEVSVVMFVV